MNGADEICDVLGTINMMKWFRTCNFFRWFWKSVGEKCVDFVAPFLGSLMD